MMLKWFLSLIGVVCLTLPAGATLVPGFSLEGLVARSETIVQGRCLRSWSDWDANHQYIWTHHEIEVSEPLKGTPARSVVVSELGGRAGDMELHVEGMPSYRPGEEVVVFLYRTATGLWRTRGLGQGKYAIRSDDGGKRRVRADLHGAVVAEMSAAPARTSDLQRLDGATLDDFKSQIRGLVTRQRKGLSQ